jgi:hypothetical protein
VDVKEVGNPTGFSAPQMIEYDGQFLLFVGAESGKIHVYNDIEANLATGMLFTKITDNILPEYIGLRASPAIADLNNDGYLDMIVGTYNGGLYWFSEDYPIGITAPEAQASPSLQIYPNPANNQLHLHWVNQPTHNGNALFQLYNLAGQVVLQHVLPSGLVFQDNVIALPTLPDGLYFAKIIANHKTFSVKVLIKQ